MVDRVMEVANQRKDSNISKTLAEDVVWVSSHFFSKVYNLLTFSLWSLSYRMFEAHMDEYLDEEIEWVKNAFDVICKGWDQEASLFVCQRGGGRVLYLCFIGNDITAHSSYCTYTVPGFAQSGLG
jgi:hypothetical protein